MKAASELITKALNNPSSTPQTDDAKTQPIGYQHNEKVEWFYKQLLALYGAGKWTSTFIDR